MFNKEDESGQSILIIALSVLAILALIALVVDVGNAYAHRRKVQNAVDAAALAGARKLAFREEETVRHIQVLQEIGDFAEANGVSRDDIEANFIKANGEWVATIDNLPVVVPNAQKAQGVSVKGYLPFPTYFAHILGFPTMEVNADAQAYVVGAPCSGDCLFPIVLSQDTFADDPHGEPVVDKTYVLWVDDLVTPGNFGWAYWVDGDGKLRGEPPQGPEVTSLEPNLLDNCRSGAWQADEWVHGDNGVNFQPVLDLLEDYVAADEPVTVKIPIYDETMYEGTNSIFHLVGFGAFQLLCAHSSRAHYVESPLVEPPEVGCLPDPDKDNTKYLTGKFVEWLDPVGFEDG
jgi:hypothetical protein